MDENYKGIIVEESLKDNRILNSLNIAKIQITTEENPKERWHLYTVDISEKEIYKIMNLIKNKWYAHFWKDKTMIVIFKNKEFKFDYDNKSSWKPAVDYGLSLGIPKEQLDFVME